MFVRLRICACIKLSENTKRTRMLRIVLSLCLSFSFMRSLSHGHPLLYRNPQAREHNNDWLSVVCDCLYRPRAALGDGASSSLARQPFLDLSRLPPPSNVVHGLSVLPVKDSGTWESWRYTARREVVLTEERHGPSLAGENKPSCSL